MKSIVELMRTGKERVSQREVVVAGNMALLFLPALFFLAAGVLAFVAPQLLIGLVAAFLFFLGGLFFVVAWKVIQLKRKFDGIAQKLQGKVIIQGLNTKPSDITILTGDIFEPKRDIFH